MCGFIALTTVIDAGALIFRSRLHFQSGADLGAGTSEPQNFIRRTLYRNLRAGDIIGNVWLDIYRFDSSLA